MLEKTNLMNMCMVCDGDKVLVIDRKKPNWPGVTLEEWMMVPGKRN